MERILEIATGSFLGAGESTQWKWLNPEEFIQKIEHADAVRLRRLGYGIDPFTVTGRFGRRAVYAITKDPEPDAEVTLAADLGDDDPFAIGIELIERQRTEELVEIEWAPEDQASAAKFEAAQSRDRLFAGLSPNEKFLAMRSPFLLLPGGRKAS